MKTGPSGKRKEEVRYVVSYGEDMKTRKMNLLKKKKQDIERERGRGRLGGQRGQGRERKGIEAKDLYN